MPKALVWKKGEGYYDKFSVLCEIIVSKTIY